MEDYKDINVILWEYTVLALVKQILVGGKLIKMTVILAMSPLLLCLSLIITTFVLQLLWENGIVTKEGKMEKKW